MPIKAAARSIRHAVRMGSRRRAGSAGPVSAADRRQIVRHEDRKLIGLPDDVARALVAHEARGDLISARPAQPVPGMDYVAMAVRLRAATVSVRRSHRVRWIAAGVVSGTAVVAGLGYLVYSAVRAIIQILPGMIAVTVLIALAWFLLGQVGACPGIHCPGCRHH
jgi:hypothetical protein